MTNTADYIAVRQELEKQAKIVETQLLAHVSDRGRLAIVQAPPGSGKTWLLLRAVQRAHQAKLRVAVATQTNAQADDICRRMTRDYPKIPVIRFAGGGTQRVDLGSSITWETNSGKLPTECCVVIGTAAKWGLVSIDGQFDVVFVEESWQLSWADFMLLGQVAERFVLIGDPGQIPPVVTVGVERWETSPRPPHRAAPDVLLGDPRIRVQAERWTLPATRRLPADAANLVKAFYDFEFGAFAALGDRNVRCDGGGRSATDKVIDRLFESSTAALTIPTPDSGPPLEVDEDLAKAASEIVKRLLARNARVKIDATSRELRPDDIGLVATHRVMNSELQLALPRSLQGKVRVDTPERWQGLERPVMIVVHPLSGNEQPTTFDLETGRLCVMASRHLAGLILLSRDHLSDTLRNVIPSADQAIGCKDTAGRGLYDNLGFWSQLEKGGHVVAA